MLKPRGFVGHGRHLLLKGDELRFESAHIGCSCISTSFHVVNKYYKYGMILPQLMLKTLHVFICKFGWLPVAAIWPETQLLRICPMERNFDRPDNLHKSEAVNASLASVRSSLSEESAKVDIHTPPLTTRLEYSTYQICCALIAPIALTHDRLLHGLNRLSIWLLLLTRLLSMFFGKHYCFIKAVCNKILILYQCAWKSKSMSVDKWDSFFVLTMKEGKIFVFHKKSIKSATICLSYIYVEYTVPGRWNFTCVARPSTLIILNIVNIMGADGLAKHGDIVYCTQNIPGKDN